MVCFMYIIFISLRECDNDNNNILLLLLESSSMAKTLNNFAIVEKSAWTQVLWMMWGHVWKKGTYANHDNIQTMKQTLSCKVTQDTVLLNSDVHSVHCSLFLWLLLRHSLLFLNALALFCRIRFPKVGFSCCNNSQRWRKQDRTVLPIGPYAARLGQCMPFVVLFALR